MYNFKYIPLLILIALTSCSKTELLEESSDKRLTSLSLISDCGSDYVFNPITPCVIDFELTTLPDNLKWSPSDNTSNKRLDFQVEQALNFNWRFNLRMIKRGQPTFIAHVENQVSYYDFENYFNDNTFEFEYFYIPEENISSVNANLVTQEIACRLTDYMALYYPSYNTSNIYDVNVYGVATLCNDGSPQGHGLVVDFNIGL